MMGDSCICVDVDDNDYWRERTVRGRREYQCVECGRDIPRGAPHRYNEAIRDGEWRHHRVCLLCHAVRTSLFKCGWYVGEVWRMVKEHLVEEMPYDEEYDEEDGDDLAWLDPPTKPISRTGW
jgi:hypothetical protein